MCNDRERDTHSGGSVCIHHNNIQIICNAIKFDTSMLFFTDLDAGKIDVNPQINKTKAEPRKNGEKEK